MSHRTFLEALWPTGIPKGMHLLFWMLKPNPRAPDNGKIAEKASFWFTNLDHAVAFLGAHVERDTNWYFRNTLTAQDFGKHNRGLAVDSVALPGLYLDMDYADGRHEKALPPTLDEAVALLEDMPLPPSIMVLTGGGAQAYWLFDKPLIFHGKDNAKRAAHREHAAALVKAWNMVLLRNCEAKGWTTDSVFDLARVFRLPDTWNVKAGVGDAARPTSILYPQPGDTTVRYEVKVIEQALNIKGGPHGLVQGSCATLPGCGNDGRDDAHGQRSGPRHYEPGGGTAGPQDGPGSGGGPAGPGAVLAGRSGAGAQEQVPGTRLPDLGQDPSDGPGRGNHPRERGDGQDGQGTRGGEVYEHAQDSRGQSTGRGLPPGVSLQEAVDAALTNLLTKPTFEATWDRRRDFNDQSLSSYDAAIALTCVHNEISDPVIAELIRMFRAAHGKNHDEVQKGVRSDYIVRTIESAHKQRDRRLAEVRAELEEKMKKRLEKEEAKINASAEGPRKPGPKAVPKRSGTLERLIGEFQEAEARGDSETQREALLGALNAALGVRVEGLVCYMAEPCFYELKANGSTLRVGGVENLMNYQKVRALCIDQLAIVLPSKVEGWDSILKALTTIRETANVGEEGTDRGVLEVALENLFNSRRGTKVGYDIEAAVAHQRPFIKNGDVYITIGALVAANPQIQRDSAKKVATDLRAYGCHAKAVIYTREDGKKTTVRAYALPMNQKWIDYCQQPEETEPTSGQVGPQSRVS